MFFYKRINKVSTSEDENLKDNNNSITGKDKETNHESDDENENTGNVSNLINSSSVENLVNIDYNDICDLSSLQKEIADYLEESQYEYKEIKESFITKIDELQGANNIEDDTTMNLYYDNPWRVLSPSS